MQASITATKALSLKSPCLIVAVYENGNLSPSAQDLDKASQGAIKSAIKSEDFKAKAGECLLLRNLPACQSERVLLLGFGSKKGCSVSHFRKSLQKAAVTVKSTAAKKVHCLLADVKVSDRDEAWKAQQTTLIFAQNLYQFDQLKSKKKPSPKLKQLYYHAVDSKSSKAVKHAVEQASATAEGIAFARDLGNLPGNVCTPSYLSKQAKKLANGDSNFTTKILGENQMAELGMHSLLSVAAGSIEPAQLIVMEYKGGPKTQAPLVLVGKGITFDTGGISLKPGATMDEMKFDMCGAASVFGAMKTIQQLAPKLNVVAIVAAAENMPDGKATKPGDIVTSMSGLTIEILNTDAEGRLVLCDALTYAERYKPKAVVDVATLTGACIVALGEHPCALYSNDDDLAQNLLDAGTQSHDRAWRMPLWEDYRPQLDSNFADLANIGGPKAGSITAACFLSHFAENYSWAHLDIAGVAWLSGANKGATGRPVSLLVNYLLNHLSSK